MRPVTSCAGFDGKTVGAHFILTAGTISNSIAEEGGVEEAVICRIADDVTRCCRVTFVDEEKRIETVIISN